MPSLQKPRTFGSVLGVLPDSAKDVVFRNLWQHYADTDCGTSALELPTIPNDQRCSCTSSEIAYAAKASKTFIYVNILSLLTTASTKQYWFRLLLLIGCYEAGTQFHIRSTFNTLSHAFDFLDSAPKTFVANVRNMIIAVSPHFLHDAKSVDPFLAVIRTLAGSEPKRKLEDITLRLTTSWAKNESGQRCVVSNAFHTTISVQGIIGCRMQLLLNEFIPPGPTSRETKHLRRQLTKTVKDFNQAAKAMRHSRVRVDFLRSLPPEVRDEIYQQLLPERVNIAQLLVGEIRGAFFVCREMRAGLLRIAQQENLFLHHFDPQKWDMGLPSGYCLAEHMQVVKIVEWDCTPNIDAPVKRTITWSIPDHNADTLCEGLIRLCTQFFRCGDEGTPPSVDIQVIETLRIDHTYERGGRGWTERRLDFVLDGRRVRVNWNIREWNGEVGFIPPITIDKVARRVLSTVFRRVTGHFFGEVHFDLTLAVDQEIAARNRVHRGLPPTLLRTAEQEVDSLDLDDLVPSSMFFH